MQYASSEDYAKYCPGGTVPPEEQDAALDAASRDIDGLTFDRIVAVGFDRLTAFQQELVKRAVCEQAEFRSVYAELLASPFSSYSINGVAMQFDGAGIVERGGHKTKRIPHRLWPVRTACSCPNAPAPWHKTRRRGSVLLHPGTRAAQPAVSRDIRRCISPYSRRCRPTGCPRPRRYSL